MSESEELSKTNTKSLIANNLLYLPRILPEWQNLCNLDKNDIQMSKGLKLTDENVSNYAHIASNVGWKGRVSHAIKHMEKEGDKIKDNDSLPMELLGNAISTIVILASGGVPSQENLFCTSLFLRCIQNEFGEYPPNISNFINFLNTHLSNEAVSALEEVGNYRNKDLPPNITITKLPKFLQDNN